MSPKQYDLYVKDCALRGITPFPNDMGTPPDVFGRMYLVAVRNAITPFAVSVWHVRQHKTLFASWNNKK